MAVADAKHQLETAHIQVLESEQRVLAQQRDLAQASSEALSVRLEEIKERRRQMNAAKAEEVTQFREFLDALNARAETLAATF